MEVLKVNPAPSGCSGRGCESKIINTSASSGIDILTQVTISGGRVMTIAADLFPLVTRRLHAFEVDKGVSVQRRESCSRENRSELLEARETKFGRLKLQGLRKEWNLVYILDLKMRRA